MYLLKENGICADAAGEAYKRYVLTGQTAENCKSLCVERAPTCRGAQFLTSHAHCQLLVDKVCFGANGRGDRPRAPRRPVAVICLEWPAAGRGAMPPSAQRVRDRSRLAPATEADPCC